MKTTEFRFKQFTVKHSKLAMKVSTDSVFLGAWADFTGANSVLDIGTGTGLLALMAAQKNSTAQIHGIDINADAYNLACENFIHSPWAARLTAFHSSIQQFESGIKYDIIISNPPYFVADMQAPAHHRNIARHSVEMNYDELAHNIARLLNKSGKAFICLAHFNLPLFKTTVESKAMFIHHIMEATATPGKPPYLALIQLGWDNLSATTSEIIIAGKNGVYSPAHRQLTEDFYLSGAQ